MSGMHGGRDTAKVNPWLNAIAFAVGSRPAGEGAAPNLKVPAGISGCQTWTTFLRLISEDDLTRRPQSITAITDQTRGDILTFPSPVWR